MRVIAGDYRGYRLTSPKGDEIRPTSDRIKENMFNVLQNYIFGDTRFLDLFAGTGAVGIEALSRGCERVTFVDSGRQAGALIAENTAKLKCPQKIKIVRSDVERFLIASRDEYDIIFMDPPYADKNTDKLMDVIFRRGLLAPGGVVITEKAVSPVYDGEFYDMFREQKYSLTTVRYYRVKNGQ